MKQVSMANYNLSCPPQRFEPIAINFQCIALPYLIWHGFDHHIFNDNNGFPSVRLGHIHLAQHASAWRTRWGAHCNQGRPHASLGPSIPEPPSALSGHTTQTSAYYSWLPQDRR